MFHSDISIYFIQCNVPPKKNAASQSVCCVQLFATPWTVAHQAPLHGTLQARLQEILLTQESDRCLLHQQMVLYHCDTWEAPRIYTRYIHTRNKFKALET